MAAYPGGISTGGLAGGGVNGDAGGTGIYPNELGVFIPELWSDEIIAAYKANIVMPQLAVVMDHVGKKGDTVHIPTPARGRASEKVQKTEVNVISNEETAKTFTIEKHFEYSRFIEDIANIQAIDTYRQFYTDDAGYALATDVDEALHAEGAKFNAAGLAGSSARDEGTLYSGAVIGGDGSTAWDPDDNSNAGNASALTDAGIRRAIQHLDDNDVPSARRSFVLPPVEKRKLLGALDTANNRHIYTQYDSVGEAGGSNSIRNGLLGDLYGVEVYVSTNVANVAATDASTDQRAVLLLQREALVLLEQLRLRSQTQYKQEYLSTLFTSDILFGTGVLRPEAGLALIVPDA